MQQIDSDTKMKEILSSRLNCLLTEDRSVETKLRENLTAEYSKLRDGVHVSDLTLCLRQSVFRKLKPTPPTQKQLGYYFDGQRRHEVLQTLFGEGVAEKKGEFEGVQYSIDLYSDFPIELKTTRAKTAISEHWLRQLIYYMLATDSRTGILQVQRVMPRGDGENLFPAYLIELTERQRQEWLKDFGERKTAVQHALSNKDPSLVPIYRGDGDWVCKECPYKAECDGIERGS